MPQDYPPIELPAEGPCDRELCDNVRPPTWRNPRPRDPYHLLVIGAGPAGLVAARGAAALGARVALVECHLLGGDSLNYGCVPSKTLIRTARLYAEMRNAAHFGARAYSAASSNSAHRHSLRETRMQLLIHDKSRERLCLAGLIVNRP